jgi:ParB-like nuclease domain
MLPESIHDALDARDDFQRARRRQARAAMRRRLLRRSAGYDLLLPFDEVIAALGRRGMRDLGRQPVELDSIVGSVKPKAGFDRRFRPTSDLVERRFERVNAAMRRGEPMPPIDVLRVGDLHFVQDGHHRVAAARALGWDTIDAHVVEVDTVVRAGRDLRLEHLSLKRQQRRFVERVPLPPAMRTRIDLRRPEDYGRLAEHVEAWAFRRQQPCGTPLNRGQAAERWFAEEYEPAVRLLAKSGPLTQDTETEAYLRLSCQRYLSTHSDGRHDAVSARPRGNRWALRPRPTAV